MSRSWLAQLNVARLRAPLDSPELEGFMALLGPINALGDAAPGFVWRHTDATPHTVGLLGDPCLLVNLSVWESVEALREFTYGIRTASAHRTVMGRRREWFHRMREAHQVLWWIPAGTLPTLAEAEARLRHLQNHRPSTYAFTFRSPRPPP